MPRPLNILLLVVDSLRSAALGPSPTGPRIPFFERLARETISFRRAYATECWTLPAHMSIFTGLLPSEHGAHFQSMAYAGSHPTIAELLTAQGFHTEVITRNTIFDGSLPGVTRGFQKNTRVLAELHGLNPLSLVLALSKPRFRRQILTTGFFHPGQRRSGEFLSNFARGTVPADREALQRVLEVMDDCRRKGRRYFVFCNLYDVHAPYPPSRRSIFRSPFSRPGALEMVLMPFVLPKLGGHAYLRPGFRMSRMSRELLLGRYHDAITLMDIKLADFYDAARAAGLFDDTLVVITSDHGEGFGEHGVYLHDASVYDTHLAVPLYVAHPELAAERVDDVISTRLLFGLFERVGRGASFEGTLLDPAYRRANPVALAEHFHYPHVPDALPQYRRDLTAAIVGDRKVIRQGHTLTMYDLASDPWEQSPIDGSFDAFGETCRKLSIPGEITTGVIDYLRRGSVLSGADSEALRRVAT